MNYIYLNPFRDRSDSQHLKAFRLKPVLTWSPKERKIRVFRLIWTKGAGPGAGGNNYSASFSFAIQFKRLFLWCGEDQMLPATRKHWRFYLPFMVVHYHRAYGGWQS